MKVRITAIIPVILRLGGLGQLAERLRVEKDLLLVPGDHFGMDGWLRVGYGEDTDLLERGLTRIHELLETF